MPLNWRSGVCEPHVRRAAILHSARALSVIDCRSASSDSSEDEDDATPRRGALTDPDNDSNDIASAFASPQIDIKTYMNPSPLAVPLDFPAARAHGVFLSLALRHLIVVDDDYDGFNQ